MNGKQARMCRAAAMKEARKSKLWARGEASVYAKRYRMFLVKFFPSFRVKYNGWIGRWYKRCIKDMIKQAKASIHDPVIQQYIRLRQKNEKRRRNNASGSGTVLRPGQ